LSSPQAANDERNRQVDIGEVLMPQDERAERPAQLTPFQRVISSRLVTGLGMFLSKRLPPSIGHAAAGLVAGLINWLKPDVYWIVHANLRQVMGRQVGERALHRVVRQVFRNTARNNYDLWRLVSRGHEALRAATHLPPDTWTHIDQARRRGKGMILVGTHTGNFDLGLLALATHGLEVQVLGLADLPTGGFDLMDQMRARVGVRLTSISIPALREAVRRLRAGGIVATGIDRPVGGAGPPVEFFGRPARLPTGHVRLALKTDAAILVAGPYRDAQGRTVIPLSPPLEMVRTGGDLEEDLRVNLRRVTAWLEECIRTRPEQWAMFVPVWPQQRAQTQEVSVPSALGATSD
jgi:KDO2-lipid IV(A) lauroyltransferase